jgi:parvulin-like peptidyl-prolyl isomerase
MRYLIDDLTEGGSAPTDSVLNDYLQKHKEIYTQEPSVTFTHVFVDASTRNDNAAKEMADKLKAELNSRGARFNDAPRYGERFPFHENYVERTLDYVRSHFGDEFTAALSRIATSENRWAGPVKSTYGYHLVLLTSRTEARLPELNEIRAQVEEDWLRDRTHTARNQGMRRLATEYTVVRKDLEDKNEK